jgi:hypothetical protein
MMEVGVVLDKGVVFNNISKCVPIVSFMLVKKNVGLHVDLSLPNFAVFILKRNREIVVHALGVLFSFCFFNFLKIFPYLFITFEDPEEISFWNYVK